MPHRLFSHPVRPGRSGAVAALVAASLLSLASLSGCAGGSDGSSAGPETDTSSDHSDGGDVSGAGDAQVDSGVPPECLDAYPAAFGAPDLAEVKTVLAREFQQLWPGWLHGGEA